jgi:hypothetical protein
LLHTIPLGYLIYYNNNIVLKGETMDRWMKTIVVLSILQVLAEILLHKFFKNCGKNLERRAALKSSVRLDDMFRVTLVAVILLGTSMLLGAYAFSDQGCVLGFFFENGVCKDCSEFVNEYCLQC